MESGEVLESAGVRPVARTPVTTKWLPAAVGVIALAIVAYIVTRPGRETPETSGLPLGEFTRITSQPGVERFPSLSPDGTHIVYASAESGNWDIYLKRVGGERVINLTEKSPADDTMPVYSPDGNSIAFRSERDGGGIFIMRATGESVRRLTDLGYLPS